MVFLVSMFLIASLTAVGMKGKSFKNFISLGW